MPAHVPKTRRVKPGIPTWGEILSSIILKIAFEEQNARGSNGKKLKELRRCEDMPTPPKEDYLGSDMM